MKKSISFILSLLIMISLFTPAIFAADNSKLNDIVMDVEETNQEIQEEIEKSVEKAQEEIDKYQENVEKLKKETEIQVEEKKLQEQLEKIINELIKDTNKLANDMVEKAAKEGVIVKCELIEVEIGGRTVLVDPLKIVNAGSV